MSLVEILVAMVVLTVGILGMTEMFRYLASGARRSSAATVASTLADEKINILKGKSYHSLLVTTAPFTDTSVSPPLTYDGSAYPPETIHVSGHPYLRAVRVEGVFQNGNDLVPVPWTAQDTGLKQITVYVLWRESGTWKHIMLRNLMTNPAATASDAQVSGTVRDATTGAPLPGARVQVLDNPDKFALSDSSGRYSLALPEGNYYISCSSDAYFPKTSDPPLSLASLSITPWDVSLVAMASAPVTSDLYARDHVVISQIVTGAGPGLPWEYIELYNPTPNPVPMGKGGPSDPDYWIDWASYLYYYNKDHAWHYSYLTYVSTYIPAHGYYLIANDASVTVGGVTVAADAHYTSGSSWKDGVLQNFNSPNHMMEDAAPGGVYLARLINGSWAVEDSVGWCVGALGPPAAVIEGTCLATTGGLAGGDRIERTASPGALSTAFGPAHDADDNGRDLLLTAGLATPRNASRTDDPLTGTPAHGAWVDLSDPLSSSRTCEDTLLPGGYSVCRYHVWAATGTWSAVAFVPGLSGHAPLMAQVEGIEVGGAPVAFPNAATTPAWPASPYSVTILEKFTADAVVSGTVRDTGGAALSGINVAADGGHSMLTDASGRYLVWGPAGDTRVRANTNNLAAAYSSEELRLATAAGTLLDTQDFFLTPSGSLRGCFQTTSLQPLANRVAIARAGGLDVATASSDASGVFSLPNLPVDTYEILPMLNDAEVAVPASRTVSVDTPGTTLFVSSFTITNGLSEVHGVAQIGEIKIPSGVFVLATTATIAGGASDPPPTIKGTSGCSPCYYEAFSNDAGEYSVAVRSHPQPYNIYAWYTDIQNGVFVTRRSGPYAVMVTEPGQTLTQDLQW